MGEIPQVRFDEAKRQAAEKYGCAMRNPNDLEPEEEQRIGLERLTMRLLGRDNVRETNLFPRDVKRLEP